MKAQNISGRREVKGVTVKRQISAEHLIEQIAINKFILQCLLTKDDQISRMKSEIVSLQNQVKSLRECYLNNDHAYRKYIDHKDLTSDMEIYFDSINSDSLNREVLVTI